MNPWLVGFTYLVGVGVRGGNWGDGLNDWGMGVGNWGSIGLHYRSVVGQWGVIGSGQWGMSVSRTIGWGMGVRRAISWAMSVRRAISWGAVGQWSSDVSGRDGGEEKWESQLERTNGKRISLITIRIKHFFTTLMSSILFYFIFFQNLELQLTNLYILMWFGFRSFL